MNANVNAESDAIARNTGPCAQWHARLLAATPRGAGVMGDFFIECAKNAEFWDSEGRRYIDFAAGIAALNTVHVYSKVQAAIAQQLAGFTHICFQVVPYTEYVSLAERLNAMVPIDGPKKTAFFAIGAEEVENAVKIVRFHTQRSGVIAFGGAFHGRSLFAVALTGRVQPYEAGFGPFAPETYHVPFPCHCADLAQTQYAMEQLFKCDIDPKRVAAIVFELVQGEGGVYPIQTAAVQWLRALCDEHGIVLIADEVQTGFARTGKMFAMEHHGVSPDIVTLAKSLAGGTTLSVVVGRADIMDAPKPRGLGGTYAGNPLAVAAAQAVLDVMAEERLCDRAQVLGARFVTQLQAAKEKNSAMGYVRALGAMMACDFVRPSSGAPDADRAKHVQQAAFKKGLLLQIRGVYGNAIRFLSPLTIEDSVFAEAMDGLDSVPA